MVPLPVSGFAPSAVSSPSRSDISSTILFDTSKNNLLGVNDGLRQIQRLLKNRWRLANTKERLNIESLSSSRLAVLAGPQERYNEAEFNALRQFIDLGGNLLVLLGEGGEQQFNTNINFLLEEYGIMINNGTNKLYCISIRNGTLINIASTRCCHQYHVSKVFPPQRVFYRRSPTVDEEFDIS